VNPLDTPEDQLDSEAGNLRNGRLAVLMGGDGVDLPKEPGRERGLLEAALAQLRLKLLDLTGRNRLLNFKHTAGRSLQFVEGAPIALYERLVEGNNRPTVAIQGLPEPERREWAERNGRLARPDPREWAQRNGVSTGYDLPEGADQPANYVRTLFYQDDLAKHCRKLEREATLAIEETGSNMLFLVLGFLEYPDQRDSDRLFSAPLVSVPVSLSRKDVSGKQTFYIQYTGEDISDNISLREKLKNDYGILIPALFDEDHASDEPVNVAAYFAELRKIINDHPRFALKNRASLALLSFTNMLLVRDLDPKKWPEKNGVHALLDHAIVRQIFEGQSDGGGSYGDAADHPVEDDPGAKIQLVYDADSSQHSALVDVLFGGKNIVIEGPPGTGKSQTITNLIAASIAEGKRVLFIAEKLAALDVVRTRLSSAGLSAFVLELHSNKTSKKKVLEELNNRIDFRTNLPTDLPLKLQRLEESRRELKRYSDLANSVVYNRLGLTLHELMWRAERHRSRITIGEATLFNLSISDACDLSAFELARRMDSLEHLGAQFNAIGGFGKEKPFWGFEPETIVPGDENRLEELLLNGREWADTFATDGGTFVASIGGGPAGLSLDEGRKQLATLAELRAGHTGRDPVHLLARLFASDGTGVRSKRLVDDLDNHLSRFQALEPAATRGVRAEDQVSAERLAALRELSRAASTLGIPLSTSAELAERHAILRSAVEPLGASAEVIGKFCDRRKIPFDGSLAKLVKLTELARVVAAAPESALAVQCAGLARDSAVADINRLRDLQSEWDILCGQTAQVLYIDIPPADQRLEDAITTLRQGTAWYRVFDGKWRSAIALHKSLQRSKQKVSAEERLQQLERVRSLKQLRGRLDGDTAWQACLGISPPTELFPLDEYLAVAQWNRDFLAALEDMTVTDISVAELTPETARALRREFAELGEAISTITASLGVMRDALPGLVGLAGGKSVQSVREAVIGFTDKLDAELPWLEMNCPGGATLQDCLAGCEAALERASIAASISINGDYPDLFGNQFEGTETDVSGLRTVLAFGDAILGSLPAPQATRLITSSDPLDTIDELAGALERVVAGLEKVAAFSSRLAAFGEFDLETWVGLLPEQDLPEFAVQLSQKLERASAGTADLVAWSSYIARRNEVGSLGLGAFRARLEDGQSAPGELADVYAYCSYASIVREAFRRVPELGKFSGLKHTQIREEFQRLDRETIKLRGKAIAASARAAPPQGLNGTRVDEKTEMVLLNYLLPQQRPRMPVRKMLSRAGRSIQALKPCFMMSPQAVAQFLSPGRTKFDLVIMDEASQLKPEQAIGAVARGSQLVVVGDPKQLPPTNFFTRGGQLADDEDEYATDAESILEVCAGQFRPSRSLKWHYRSQHHSLIAFSNAHFYKNLIIFPSPYGQSATLGVRATYLADAIYDNQTNLKEAKRVVDAVVEHIQSRPKDSLGVVTLNVKQRDLISELLEDRLNGVKEADEYRQHWRDKEQPLFIRNLENVQGDERDAIIISTTFGRPPDSGVVRQNFGPISRQGGWRRLNVLFTRAKKSVAVFTSLRPEDIVIDGSTPEGTRAFRNYLEYARTGQLTVPEDTGAAPDSDFEVAVMDVLRMRGYEVTPQLGVAGYRIDIAVKHPDAPGTYLAAIECDGASYHSAASVRDRDRIRQDILESVGWRGRIWRIWSTDWFRTPRQETEKLLSFLDDLRKSWKPEHSSGASWVEEGTAPIPRPADVPANEADRRVVSQVLLETDEEIEVAVGDIVRYAEVSQPTDVLTVRIVRSASDLANGLISVSAPLAQTLLGGVVGDEVVLHVPGSPARVFRILEIKRSE
jgi:hypothetical protein